MNSDARVKHFLWKHLVDFEKRMSASAATRHIVGPWLHEEIDKAKREYLACTGGLATVLQIESEVIMHPDHVDWLKETLHEMTDEDWNMRCEDQDSDVMPYTWIFSSTEYLRHDHELAALTSYLQGFVDGLGSCVCNV